MASEILADLQAGLGIGVFLLLAWVLGERRSVPGWRLVAAGLGLQFLFAWLVFASDLLQSFLGLINQGVQAIVRASETGTAFVFGYLGGDPANITYPYAVTDTASTVVLAFRILPLIMFFSVLSAVLWHYRVLPVLINAISAILQRSLGVGGAVGLSAAANVFVGMVESPALIRPYLGSLSRSELFVVMSCGMATVAGSVMILYAVMLEGVLANPLGHILTASVISAPAAIMVALLMVPADGSSNQQPVIPPQYHNLMDAISRGTQDGLRLMVNVGAMLVVLVALVALVNSVLAALPLPASGPLTLQGLFGIAFAPLAWLMGIPWEEAAVAGSLMGIKTVLNELLGFLALSQLEQGSLSPRSAVIITYAMCGFANFGSLGIMIGGLCAMCPNRVAEIVQLAPRSLISGTLATCMTGAVAGILT